MRASGVVGDPRMELVVFVMCPLGVNAMLGQYPHFNAEQERIR